MSNDCRFELVRQAPVSVVRLVNPNPAGPEKQVGAALAEWNSLAEIADCQTLVIDCSRVKVLGSEMLSKLIVLQRRLKQRKAKLVLTGLSLEIQEILSWTKLDRFFEIQEDARLEAASVA